MVDPETDPWHFGGHQAWPETGVAGWNDFINPLIYVHDSDQYTLAVGLNYFRTMPDMAATHPPGGAAA